jgi:IS605 OrfB family transposase
VLGLAALGQARLAATGYTVVVRAGFAALRPSIHAHARIAARRATFGWAVCLGIVGGCWCAARTLITWAVQHRVGTLTVGDPRGVLALDAGRRHNQRVRAWRIGHLLHALRDKAETAGITLTLVDERGTSSTCPACDRRIPRPAGRVMSCPHCGCSGHRDLLAAANNAARAAAAPQRPSSRPLSRTAAPGRTCQVCHRRGVTPGAAPITAPPAGPLAGTGPPHPARARRGVARPTARST